MKKLFKTYLQAGTLVTGTTKKMKLKYLKQKHEGTIILIIYTKLLYIYAFIQ